MPPSIFGARPCAAASDGAWELLMEVDESRITDQDLTMLTLDQKQFFDRLHLQSLRELREAFPDRPHMSLAAFLVACSRTKPLHFFLGHRSAHRDSMGPPAIVRRHVSHSGNVRSSTGLGIADGAASKNDLLKNLSRLATASGASDKKVKHKLQVAFRHSEEVLARCWLGFLQQQVCCVAEPWIQGLTNKTTSRHHDGPQPWHVRMGATMNLNTWKPRKPNPRPFPSPSRCSSFVFAQNARTSALDHGQLARHFHHKDPTCSPQSPTRLPPTRFAHRNTIPQPPFSSHFAASALYACMSLT